MRLSLRRLGAPLVALAAAGAVLVAPSSDAAGVRFTPFRVNGQPLRAITLTEQRQDAALSIADLRRIKADGFNAVTMYVYRYMDVATASEQKTGAFTEPDAVLGLAIDQAHSAGLAVQLVPTIWVGKGVGPFYWRGAIHPADRNLFFDSYRAMVNHYADLATQHHVEILGIGSEMVSLENEAAQWQHTISDARQHFRGPLAYFTISATVERIKWWRFVDLPGLSPYVSLSSKDSPGYDEIVNNWRRTQLPALRRAAVFVGRPMQIAEIGYGSGPGAATHPEQAPGYPADERLQADLYRAMLDVVLPDRSFDGISFWRWSAAESGPANTGFSPKGKQAECVVAQRWAAAGSTSLAQCSAAGRVSL